MVTLKDIADRCGVSVATVSNILNGKPKVSEKTKEQVMRVVKELNYQPNLLAQGMRKKNTNMIGIIVDDLKEFSATPIVETLMSVFEENNYRTLLINLRLYDKWQDTWYRDYGKIAGTLMPALQELQSIRVDGIIYVAGHCREITYFPEDFPIPVLFTYAFAADGKYPSVILDDEEGGYLVTKHLIDHGHRKIGVITGVAENYHTQHRLIGYQRALYESQVLFSPQFVKNGDWERESGRRCMEELLKEGVTAVFCMNDIMAAGAYDVIYEHGLEVAKDISVVGYDDRNISAYMRPTLTTNDILLEEIGTISANMMIEMLNRPEDDPLKPEIIRVGNKLVVRDSVGPNN